MKLRQRSSLILVNTKYIFIAILKYEDLRAKAVSNSMPLKKYSLSNGKKLAYKMIDNVAKM
jgi:hypothetical protein